jgi:hypothetical protein
MGKATVKGALFVFHFPLFAFFFLIGLFFPSFYVALCEKPYLCEDGKSQAKRKKQKTASNQFK